jgi:hypothetical protein
MVASDDAGEGSAAGELVGKMAGVRSQNAQNAQNPVLGILGVLGADIRASTGG